MNWEDFQIFDAAASSGSLSAGAKTLGLSQPQMSRRLRELEEKIGVRLFERTPQGLRPTAAGAKLIPLTENMRMAADAILRAKPDLASRQLTVVRISVDEIRQHFITTHLHSLGNELENIELEIFSGHEHLNHESRMTDIQIRSCLPDSETLVSKRVGETGYGLYASKEFAARHDCLDARKNGRHTQLPWIGISPDHLWFPQQLKWLEERFENSSTLRFNTMTGIIAATQSGLGLAMLPHFMAQEHRDLVHIAKDDIPLMTVEYMIVHRDLLREKAVRRTIDVLTALYRKHSKSLRGDS